MHEQPSFKRFIEYLGSVKKDGSINMIKASSDKKFMDLYTNYMVRDEGYYQHYKKAVTDVTGLASAHPLWAGKDWNNLSAEDLLGKNYEQFSAEALAAGLQPESPVLEALTKAGQEAVAEGLKRQVKEEKDNFKMMQGAVKSNKDEYLKQLHQGMVEARDQPLSKDAYESTLTQLKLTDDQVMANTRDLIQALTTGEDANVKKMLENISKTPGRLSKNVDFQRYGANLMKAMSYKASQEGGTFQSQYTDLQNQLKERFNSITHEPGMDYQKDNLTEVKNTNKILGKMLELLQTQQLLTSGREKASSFASMLFSAVK